MDKPWFKKWPKEYPKTLKYYEGNVAEFLAGSAKKFPDRIVCDFMGKQLTYGELEDLVNRFATALANLGIKKGNTVALLFPNCPQFLISYYAALRIGARVTMCSPLHSERELLHHLNDSGAETIVTLKLKLTYDKVIKIRKDTKLKHIIVSELQEYLGGIVKLLFPIVRRKAIAKVEKADYIYSFKELLKTPPNPPKVTINPKEDIAVLAYTGGTTGLPKGAMLTHYNTIANCTQVAAWLAPGLGIAIKPEYTPDTFQNDEYLTALVVVPWFHAMGTIAYMNVLVFGGYKMAVLPNFEPLAYMKAMHKYKPVALGGAPPMYVPILSHPKLNNFKGDFARVKLVGSGAGPLPVENMKKLRELVEPGGGVILEAYGLTECTMGALFNPAPKDADRKLGGVGLPIPDTEIKVIDDTGNEVEIGKDGELIMKGPQVMKGYWNRPDETAETLKDGWLYTGDIVHIDEEGYTFIVDRKKDMLKYKGYQYSSRELEEVLYEHPAIKQAAVIGIKTDMGDIPKAFIVLKEGSKVTPEEIQEFMKDKVAVYKKIKQFEFKKELPVSLAGKVLKRELREGSKTE